MKRYLVERTTRALARRNGADASYVMALYDASPAALRGIGKVSAMLRHREAIPVEAALAAQLVGALQEGCGSCVQIHINMARQAKVADGLIAAILCDDHDELPPDAALAAWFASAIGRRSTDEAEAREAVRARWGEKGVIDLTMATQVSRFLTMLKAGFGYASTCTSLSVGERTVLPKRRSA